jgi:hypothetical protein
VNGAIIYRWGPVVRGREQESVEAFAESAAYWDGLVDSGRVASHEPYFSGNRNGGYWIMKGDLDELTAITNEDDYQRLVWKVTMIVEEWSMELCVGGSAEDLGDQIGTFLEVAENFS